MAFIEGVSTACYIPMCLYAKYGTCASCTISLKTLMEISLACGLMQVHTQSTASVKLRVMNPQGSVIPLR